MRLLHREPDTVDERDAATGTDDRPRNRAPMFGRRARTDGGTVADERPVDTTAGDRTVARREPVANEPRTRRVRRTWAHRPFHFGNFLAIVGGAVLAVIGIIALLRGDLNRSWDAPVTTVLRIDHTPLLAAAEIVAGGVMVLLAVTGLRYLTLLWAVIVAGASAVAAIQPGRLATQYHLETWWAWTVAGCSAFIALVLLLPSGRRKEVIEEPVATTT